MIKVLNVRNFKSIKDMEIHCKKINVFIGEPNTGKSNILESLGMLSFCTYYYSGGFQDFVRVDRISDLFYDGDLKQEIEICWDETLFALYFKNGAFEGNLRRGSTSKKIIEGSYSSLNPITTISETKLFKFYRFQVIKTYGMQETECLLPPSGQNLLAILLVEKRLLRLLNQLLLPTGLRLGLRAQENKIEFIKQSEDVIISYPYHITSETLQRLNFHMVAIHTNKNSVIVFEEPEAHAFPFYTKYLAEIIALDENNNQYFISTHNPYFLMPLLEKSPIDQIAIFLTYYKDYQTKLKPLSHEDIKQLTEVDVFSNIERFLSSP